MASQSGLGMLCVGLFLSGCSGNESSVSDNAWPAMELQPTSSVLPMLISPNEGGEHEDILATAKVHDGAYTFLDQGIVFAFRAGDSSEVAALHFVGANPDPEVDFDVPSDARIHHIGSRGAHSVTPFQRLRYRDLWPGIDLICQGGRAGEFKYAFMVDPGANVDAIQLQWMGPNRPTLAQDGSLTLSSDLGELRDRAPVSYQNIQGTDVELRTHFSLDEDGDGSVIIGFELDTPRDPTQPVLVDPGITYGAVIGGSDDESASALAVDATGAVYVVGETLSVDFPSTPGAAFEDLQDNSAAPILGTGDVYVTKVVPSLADGTGSDLIWATYLGGSNGEKAHDITLHDNGDVFITGSTRSPDFPTTALAFGPTLNGFDAFVAGLSPDGSQLTYGTFLGGPGGDIGTAIQVDEDGGLLVTGVCGPGFPTTAGAHTETTLVATAAFVARLLPNAADGAGSDLDYSTLIVGNSSVAGEDIRAHQGNILVTGRTLGDGLPATSGAFDTTYNGGEDNYIASFQPEDADGAGGDLVFLSYLGGSDDERQSKVNVDSQGRLLVVGYTDSSELDSNPFPVTANGFDTTWSATPPTTDLFLVRMTPDASAVDYGTYIGGSGSDRDPSIAVDDQDNVFVVGHSVNNLGPDLFPITANAGASSPSGEDLVVVKLNLLGLGSSDLAHGTFINGVASVGRKTDVAMLPTGQIVVLGTGIGLTGTGGAFEESPQGLKDTHLWVLDLAVCGDGALDVDEPCDDGIPYPNPGFCPQSDAQCDDFESCTTDSLVLGGTCGNGCLNEAIPDCCGNGTCDPATGETCGTCPADCGGCCGDGVCDSAANEDCLTCQADCGSCCGDGVCDGAADEDCASCQADCGSCCGDGVCDVAGEGCLTCPADCGQCCGDGVCDEPNGEACLTCPADCGQCCGDGLCDAAAGETFSTCPADCGSCGNGTVEAGEACDDGNANTLDDCIDCQVATCGDGYLQVNVEECDELGALPDPNCNNCAYDCAFPSNFTDVDGDGLDACFERSFGRDQETSITIINPETNNVGASAGSAYGVSIINTSPLMVLLPVGTQVAANASTIAIEYVPPAPGMDGPIIATVSGAGFQPGLAKGILLQIDTSPFDAICIEDAPTATASSVLLGGSCTGPDMFSIPMPTTAGIVQTTSPNGDPIILQNAAGWLLLAGLKHTSIAVFADADLDDVSDDVDNCPLEANTDQADVDGDGEGDVCDVLTVTMRVTPSSLNRRSNGNWVTAHVESDLFATTTLDLDTVTLASIPADRVNGQEDDNQNGIPDVPVKFDRQDFVAALNDGSSTVQLRGTLLTGEVVVAHADVFVQAATCIPPEEGLQCDDANACTTDDACLGGTCTGTQIDCDDSISCTVDSCDSAAGCTNVADPAACDDNDPCTDDLCTPQGCISVDNSSCNPPALDLAFDWVRTSGGIDTDFGHALDVAADGSSVQTGFFDSRSGPAVFGAGQPTETLLTTGQDASIYVASYDAGGDLAWAVGGDGTSGFARGDAVAIAGNGEVLVAGGYRDPLVLGAGEPQETTLPGGNDALDTPGLVARYATAGDLIWARSIAIGSVFQARVQVTDIEEAPDGTVLVAGSIIGVATFGQGEVGEQVLSALQAEDAFLARYQSDGRFIDVRRVQGQPGAGSTWSGIAVAADGSIRAAGSIRGEVFVGPGESGETFYGSTSTTDTVVASFAPNGDLQWLQGLDGSAPVLGRSAFPHGIALDAAGNAYTVGSFNGPFVLGFGQSGETSLDLDVGESQSVFLASFSPTGTLLWADKPGTGPVTIRGGDVAVWGNALHLSGTFSGANLVLGAGSAEEVTFPLSEPNAAFLASFDLGGPLQSAELVFQASSIIDGGLGTDATGAVYLGGSFQASTAVFGAGGPNETTVAGQGGSLEIFLAKFER